MAGDRPGAKRWHPRKLQEAIKPEFGFPEAWVVWAMRALLLGLALYSLVVTPRYTTRGLIVSSALLGLGVSLLFAFVATTRPRTLKAAEAAVLGMFLLHVLGHAVGLYERFAYYDKGLHFLEPFVAALVIYALSQATDWIWQWRRVTPLEVGIYCFSMVVAIGALWELMEFGMDQLFGTEEQNGNTDTMIDILMDVTGAFLGALAAALTTRYGRRHGHDKVSEEPKSDAPKRHFTKREVREG